VSSSSCSHVSLRSVHLCHVFLSCPVRFPNIATGGPFKRFQNNAPVPFPLSLVNATSSSSPRLASMEPPLLRSVSIFGAAPADLISCGHGSRGLLDAGAAPIDADVKVHRCHRAFGLGRQGTLGRIRFDFGVDSISGGGRFDFGADSI
jgi:hypothetical protein